MTTASVFWRTLGTYNQAIYPVQIILYLMIAIAAVVLLFRGAKPYATILIKAVLSISFSWIGIVFFLTMGQSLTAYGASAFLFLSLAVIFAVDIFAKTMTFAVPGNAWRRAFIIAGLVLTLAYPAIGLFLGHPLTQQISPGAFPCPTTAFALLAIAAVPPQGKRRLLYPALALLTIWSIPFPIFLQIPKYGVYEDAIMLAAGLFTLITRLMLDRKKQAAN